MSIEIKICGLSTAESLEVALDAGADLIGLVFFEPSPRNVGIAEARQLAERARGRAKIVALMVNPDDALYVNVIREVAPDIVQLHGSETPDRIAMLRTLSDCLIMKAFGVADGSDLEAVSDYTYVADLFLPDAKQPRDASRPGGNGRVFDWSLLQDFNPERPWFLSGGLTADNIASARDIAKKAGFAGVDVSSGVELTPGVKDPDLIRAFIGAARQAFSETPRSEPILASDQPNR